MEALQENVQKLMEQLLDTSEKLMKVLVEREQLRRDNDSYRQHLGELYTLLTGGGFEHPLSVKLHIQQLQAHFENGAPLDPTDPQPAHSQPTAAGAAESVDTGVAIVKLGAVLESLRLALNCSVETDCPICIAPLAKGRALFTTECNHRFHFSCIQRSDINGDKPCPYCRHELKEHPITSKVDAPADADWFYGLITKPGAETLLTMDGSEGAFLVRESSTRPGNFTVSFFSSGMVRHTHVHRTLDERYAITQSISFPTISDLIAYYSQNDFVWANGTRRTRFLRPVEDPEQLRTAHATWAGSSGPRNLSGNGSAPLPEENDDTFPDPSTELSLYGDGHFAAAADQSRHAIEP